MARATVEAVDAAHAPPGATLEGGGSRPTGGVKALARCASIVAGTLFLACRPISAVPHLSMARIPG